MGFQPRAILVNRNYPGMDQNTRTIFPKTGQVRTITQTGHQDRFLKATAQWRRHTPEEERGRIMAGHIMGTITGLNLFQPISGLELKTPAQAAGIQVPFRQWDDLAMMARRASRKKENTQKC